MPVHILITGASGGLGASLARRYARPGMILSLWGRDTARLEATAAQCRKHGAIVRLRTVDLQDTDAALKALRDEDDALAVDIAIFNAGLSDIRPPDALSEDPAHVLALCTVNFTTPAVLATEISHRMIKREIGRIALIGSTAAFHDLPFATGYSGSKAGLARFATALAGHARRYGVSVLLVSPGYIDTAMSRRLSGSRPLLISADRAASKIVRAIAQGRAHLLFPWPFHVVRGIEMITPRWIQQRLLARVKVSQKPR